VCHVSPPSSYQSRRGHIHLPRVLPLVGCQSKTLTRTHAACGSGMEAPSAAISPLGLVLDLMWHKVFMRMRRRSTAWSGGSSTSLAGAGSWKGGRWSKAVARSLPRTRERESGGSRSDSDGGRRRGMGSTLPRAVLFIGGPPNLSIAVPSTVQCASTALSREVCEKIKADFSLTGYIYDLNLSLARSPKRQHQVVLMATCFASPRITLI
jgi:hypothetical protein